MRCSLCVVGCRMVVVCWLLFIGCCLFVGVGCLMFVVFCLVFADCCGLLRVGCWLLLFVVCCVGCGV